MSADHYLTPEEQRLLRNIRIGVAGAGGLGSNVLMHLVRSGLEQFVIADFDTVSESNLNRQFFFRDQLGKLKTEAAAENLKRISLDLSLELHAVRVTAENALFLFNSCDLLVEAFDSAEAKAMLIRQWMPTGKPLVAASGLAGWGRSNAMRTRKIGKNLYLCGDFETGIDRDSPHSPRVGLAAALQANTVMAILLGKEI